MKDFISNDEVVMIKPIAPMFEGEEEIPDNVKRFDEEDILDAEIIQESKINESLNVSLIENKLNLKSSQVDFIDRLSNNSKVYIVTGFSAATNDAWMYLFEILETESTPYFTMEYYLGSDIPLMQARTDATTLAMKWINYRNQGLSIEQTASKMDMEINQRLFENKSIFENKSEILGKCLASNVKQGQRVRFRGKIWMCAGHEGINDDALLNCLDDSSSTKVKGNKQLTLVSENYILPNHGILQMNEDLDEEMARWEIISSTDFWKKFKEEWNGADVYNYANALLVDYAMQPEKLKEKLRKLLTNYDMIEDYEDLLNSAVFEYKNKGTYIGTEEEVEDLYYIQKGDYIIVNHRDYGKIECLVSRVDVDKNKVYFHSKEKGIMGVCGFDKIHGIRLVDESKQKINENVFTEMDWSELTDLIEKHKAAGNIERYLNNSTIVGSSKDKIEFAIYCPNNDCLDAFLTEYNFLKYGKLIDVIYVSTNNVVLRSHLDYDNIFESVEKIKASNIRQYQKIKHKGKNWLVIGHEGVDDDIIINSLEDGSTDRISGKKSVELIVECVNTAVVSISGDFSASGSYTLMATQEGNIFNDPYIQIGHNSDNLVPHKMPTLTKEQWDEICSLLDSSETDEIAYVELYNLGLIEI